MGRAALVDTRQIGGDLLGRRQLPKAFRPLRLNRGVRCSSSPADSLSLAWPGLESLYAESQRTRYTVDFHKAPFTGLGLTFASHPETGEVGLKLLLHFTVDDILADSPASYSQIQIGDRLRMVSSACEDGVSAAQSKQASRYRRRRKKREKVRFLFERPSAWELVRRVEPAAGPGVGSVSCSAASSSSAPKQLQQSAAGKSMQLTFSRRSQSGELPAERRKMERPKTHREQAAMLAGLIEEANDLPPILLTAAAQRRWALEFEGETLMTYRRGGEDRWTLSGRHAIGQVSSNIVPMPRFLYVDPSCLYPAAAPTAPPQRVGPASQAFCVLPWLMMTSGHLETKDFETIASVCGLTRLLDLDLDSSALYLEPGSSSASSPEAVSPPQHIEPLVLARSAAALQRLVIRRGGIGNDQDLMEHCCILVHTAKACAATQLATVLAAWFHWYGRLDLQTAIQNAEMSLGISPDASAIAAASKLLLDSGIRRRQAVRLCWPYGGHSMEVAGDVLGGWHVRTRLDQQSSPSGCSTKIEGLQPGTYRYKFIVDGMWVVDMALPAECDNEGNTNNVVHVPDFSPQTLKPDQAASFIRVEAARMALAAKFGVGQSKRRSRQ